MPRFDQITKGLAIGIGVAILIPVAWKTLVPMLKPAARSAMKTGIRALEKGREMVAETSEKVEDLVAETQAEMRAKRTVIEDKLDKAAVGATKSSGPTSGKSNARKNVNE